MANHTEVLRKRLAGIQTRLLLLTWMIMALIALDIATLWLLVVVL
jgi:hypothetical protein